MEVGGSVQRHEMHLSCLSGGRTSRTRFSTSRTSGFLSQWTGLASFGRRLLLSSPPAPRRPPESNDMHLGPSLAAEQLQLRGLWNL